MEFKTAVVRCAPSAFSCSLNLTGIFHDVAEDAAVWVTTGDHDAHVLSLLLVLVLVGPGAQGGAGQGTTGQGRAGQGRLE